MKSIDGHLSLLLSDWSDCYFLESQGFLYLNWYLRLGMGNVIKGKGRSEIDHIENSSVPMPNAH